MQADRLAGINILEAIVSSYGGGGGSRTIHAIENRRVADSGWTERTKMPTMPNRLYVYCTEEKEQRGPG